MNDVIAGLTDRTPPVLPVIQVQQAEDIIPIGEALFAGGLNALEITLRTEAGLEAIRLARRYFPDAVICAGTVTNVTRLQAAADAGAEFVVTPGISQALISAAVSSSVPILPGVATPSELMLGLDAGLRHFKLFPAGVVGGSAMLKALHGPFPEACFCPTGGLDEQSWQATLNLPNVFCVGGSWMVVKKDGAFQPEDSRQAAQAISEALQWKSAS